MVSSLALRLRPAWSGNKRWRVKDVTVCCSGQKPDKKLVFLSFLVRFSPTCSLIYLHGSMFTHEHGCTVHPALHCVHINTEPLLPGACRTTNTNTKSKCEIKISIQSDLCYQNLQQSLVPLALQSTIECSVECQGWWLPRLHNHAVLMVSQCQT